MTKIFKKPWVIIVIIILIIGAFAVQKLLSGSSSNKFNYVIASKGEIIQEVSVTGTVKPAESVNLSFELSGIVNSVDVEVGQKVEPNQLLANLKSTELYSEISQAQANLESRRATQSQAEASLESAEIQLAQYISGTRTEEINIAQASVSNSEASLNDAQINLTNTQNTAEISLNKLYDEVYNVLHDAYAKANDALSNQTETLFSNAFGYSPKLELTLSSSSLKNQSQHQRLLANRALEDILKTIDSLDMNSQENLDQALTDSKNNLSQIRNLMATLSSALNYAVGESQATITTHRNNINLAQTNLNTAINSVDSQARAITTQKATNEYNISVAQSNLTTAQNNLKSAQENLYLKQAGYTEQQIANQRSAVKQAEANLLSQKAQVRQAEANITGIHARLEKTILRSPISGIVTQKEIEIGELVSPGKTVFTIISEANYQIEANIPEIDIAKIKLGDSAHVTLDTYGSGKKFEIKVVSIDPAERIIEGVPTYRTTFEFVDDEDLVKSGMTANIDVLTDYRQDVISIPTRAIGPNQTVKILNTDGLTYKDVSVELGIRSSDGYVEIISGVNVGDKVIISIN